MGPEDPQAERVLDTKAEAASLLAGQTSVSLLQGPRSYEGELTLTMSPVTGLLPPHPGHSSPQEAAVASKKGKGPGLDSINICTSSAALLQACACAFACMPIHTHTHTRSFQEKNNNNDNNKGQGYGYVFPSRISSSCKFC